MTISQRVQHMDASGIRKAFELAGSLIDPIDLSIGQPDFMVPQAIKTSAIDAIMQDRNRYTVTQGIEQLREMVAEKLRIKNHIDATKDHILITSAVSGGLNLALPTCIDPGDEVIIFDPCFVGYRQLVLLYGGMPVAVAKKNDFSIDFDALCSAITSKTKVIILNTPENPTGHVSNGAEIKKLADIARVHDLVVIADEIYEDFVYDGEHMSIGSLYENTITLGGFSKSHAMTGWRVGYLCAPMQYVEEMMKVQQYTFVCAPTPFQYAAMTALTENISLYVAQYKKKRDMVYDALKDIYDIVRSDGAFYFFVKYPYDGKLFIDRCLEYKLLVVPGGAFSVRDTHFRISFATSDEQLHKAIEILQRIAS